MLYLYQNERLVYSAIQSQSKIMIKQTVDKGCTSTVYSQMNTTALISPLHI